MTDHSPTSPKWDADTTSQLVPLATHSLFLRAAGPARKDGHPAVIVVSGFGHSSVHWTAVARLLSSFVRVYTYDRSGYGSSEPNPSSDPQTAIKNAQELQALLEASKIKPPYIIVSHSYGGIIAREFMALKPESVLGMVFVDANTEHTCRVRPEGLQYAMEDIMSNVDYYAVIKLDSRQRMTSEEWNAAQELGSQENQKKHQQAISKEAIAYEQSCNALGDKEQYEKQVLGDGVVSVIFGNNEADIRKLYEAAVAKRYGSEKSRAVVDEWLNSGDAELRLQEEQLRLSKSGRLVHALESGHDVQFTEPHLIFQEVEWVLSTSKDHS